MKEFSYANLDYTSQLIVGSIEELHLKRSKIDKQLLNLNLDNNKKQALLKEINTINAKFIEIQKLLDE